MRTYKYKVAEVVEIDKEPVSEQLEAVINRMTANDWEYVETVPHRTRPIFLVVFKKLTIE